MDQEDVADDPQKIKRIAAAAYEYERDPRWADYWSNLLIPSHMASRPDVLDRYKRKFYQRYIDPDLVIDPISSSSSRSSSSSGSRPGPASVSEQPRTQNAASPNASSARTAPARASSMGFDQRKIPFCINSLVIIVTLLSILPLVPKSLANKGYLLSLLGTVFSSIFSLYRRHGKPTAWNLPALQTWLQSMIIERDFLYLVYSLIFIPFPAYFKFALLPLLLRAVERVAKFLRCNFSRSFMYRKYLDTICLWVEVNVATLNILSSSAEVALGFLLILALFTWKRNIIQVFIYWHLLKLLYHVPVTSGYHRNVWTNIGRAVNPYINRYASFLNSPLSTAQRWWLN